MGIPRCRKRLRPFLLPEGAAYSFLLLCSSGSYVRNTPSAHTCHVSRLVQGRPVDLVLVGKKEKKVRRYRVRTTRTCRSARGSAPVSILHAKNTLHVCAQQGLRAYPEGRSWHLRGGTCICSHCVTVALVFTGARFLSPGGDFQVFAGLLSRSRTPHQHHLDEQDCARNDKRVSPFG